MNIKTTKKLIISIILALVFMILGTVNKVHALSTWEEKVKLEETYGTTFTINATTYNHNYISKVLVHKLDKTGNVVEKNLKAKKQNGKDIYNDSNVVISIEDINFTVGYGSKSKTINIYSDNDNETTRYYRFEVQFWHKSGTMQEKKNFDVTVKSKTATNNKSPVKETTTTYYYKVNNNGINGDNSIEVQQVTLAKITGGIQDLIKLYESAYGDKFEILGISTTEKGEILKNGDIEANKNKDSAKTYYIRWDNKKTENPIKTQSNAAGTAENGFTIKYYDGDKEYTNLKQEGKFGTTVTLASAQTKEGYKFKEWNTEKDGSGTTRKAGSSLSVNRISDIKYYAQWEKTSKNADTNKVSGLSGILGSLINIGKSTLPTLVEQGMSIIQSDTVKSLVQNAFGGISKIFGGLTENAGNSLFNLFSSKKEKDPEAPQQQTQEGETEELGTKVLYKELNVEVENNKVNLYVIKLDKELYVEMDELGKVIINNKYPIYVVQAEKQVIVLMGIEEKDGKYESIGNLYLDKESKIYKKVDNKYIEIAKFETPIKNLEEKYYEFKAEELVGTITSDELEKLLNSETQEENAVTNNSNKESNNQKESLGIENIGENLNKILSSDLLNVGLEMAENFAGTATGLIGNALDKVGTVTGATGITNILKGVVNSTGEFVSSGTARKAVTSGLSILQNIGKGLTTMFGSR